MCKVQDVVDFFVDFALNDPEETMTNKRINKLLYFAQGWSLAKRDKPLFEDDFYAWTYGPVIPGVYQRLKIAGNDKIQGIDNDTYEDNFTSEESMLLIDVLREYAKYSTNGLVDLTHQHDNPWFKAYSVKPSSIISKEDIKEYFKTLSPPKSFSLPALTDKDFIGHRDEKTGNYVLPGAWLDE